MAKPPPFQKKPPTGDDESAEPTPDSEGAEGEAAPGGDAPLPNKAEQARAAQLQSEAPRPKEPLRPDVMGAFTDSIRAVAKLAGRDLPDIPPPPGPIAQVPGPIYQAVVTIASFIEAEKQKIPGLGDYAFDPQAACTSTEGMMDATRKMTGFAGDRAVQMALHQAPQGASRAQPTPATKGPPPGEPTPTGAAGNFAAAVRTRKEKDNGPSPAGPTPGR